MAEKHTTRIDKWLWAVRIFKTRALATEACTGGKIKIDGTAVKASRNIVQNDIVQIRKGVVKYIYKVRKIAEKRIYPAINIRRSGTRREDLLTSPEELQRMFILRKILDDMEDSQAIEFLIERLKSSKTNEEFFSAMKSGNGNGKKK